MADKKMTATKGLYYVKAPIGSGGVDTLIGLAQDINYSESLNVTPARGLGDFWANELEHTGGSVTVDIGHYIIDLNTHPLAVKDKDGNVVSSPVLPNVKTKDEYADWLMFGSAEIILKIDKKDVTYNGLNGTPSQSEFLIIEGLKMTSRTLSFAQDSYVTGRASFIGNSPAIL